jgi:hypothetical protein
VIVDGPEGWIGAYTSLVLDVDGQPHIGYEGDTTLKYAYKDSTGWKFESVGGEGQGGQFLSIALDNSGMAWISSYYESEQKTLNIAHREVESRKAASWQIEEVDHSQGSGRNNSLVLDAKDLAHTSYGIYAEYVGTGLMYARREPDGWKIEAVDLTSSGEHSSLALDENGNPCVSYQAGANLWYASRETGGWQRILVEAGGSGSLGQYNSLAVDEAGYAHISYYNQNSGELKYAYQNGSGWHQERVIWESDKHMGEGTSLALHPDGYPRIAFRVGLHDDDLGYAYKDITGWHAVIVKSEGQVGYGVSMALDADGWPHISYHNWTDNTVEYAYLDAGGWHFESVEPSYFGTSTSLALDSSGWPHISYRQGLTVGLRHAYRDVNGWHVKTVDSSLHAGYSSALALDSENRPHIIYSDDGSQDLRYAFPWEGDHFYYLPLVVKGD